MIEKGLSSYNPEGEISSEKSSLEEKELDTISLGEESQMAGIALEMTATFDFIKREKEVEELEDEEETYTYSGLQIFTLSCFISSFVIAMIGIFCLFLWK